LFCNRGFATDEVTRFLGDRLSDMALTINGNNTVKLEPFRMVLLEPINILANTAATDFNAAMPLVKSFSRRHVSE